MTASPTPTSRRMRRVRAFFSGDGLGVAAAWVSAMTASQIYTTRSIYSDWYKSVKRVKLPRETTGNAWNEAMKKKTRTVAVETAPPSAAQPHRRATGAGYARGE